MKTKEEILKDLTQYYGTEHWYAVVPGLTMTDGVKYLCEAAECFWLIDAIASWQGKARKSKALKDAQFWSFKLTSLNPRQGVLECGSGSRKAKPVITQKIESTDFPLDNIQLYCMPSGSDWVILLPSEY